MDAAQATSVIVMLLLAVMEPPAQSFSIMRNVIIPNPMGNPKPMRSVSENLQDIILIVKNPVRKTNINAVVIIIVDWLRVGQVV